MPIGHWRPRGFDQICQWPWLHPSGRIHLAFLFAPRGLSRLRTRTKQCRADAYQGRAFLDRRLEITAHAHAQVRQWRAERFFTLRLELAQPAEDRPDLLGIRRPR